MNGQPIWSAAVLALLLMPALNAGAAGMPHIFSPGDPALADEVNENFEYAAPRNIINVNRVPGASDTVSGSLLLDALDPASLSAINGAPSASNQYLVRLAPGVFNIGGSAATLSPHVYIQGAGPGATRITGNGSNTVILANNSGVSDVTLAATGSATGAAPLRATSIANASVTNVEILVGGTGTSVQPGIAVSGASLLVRNSRILHNLSGNTQASLSIAGSNSVVNIDGLRIDMAGSSATTAYALEMITGSNNAINARNLRVVAHNNGGTLMGVRLGGSNPIVNLDQTRITLTGSATRDPLFVGSSTARINVNHSVLISGNGGASDHFLRLSDAGGIVRVGASQLGSTHYTHSAGASGVNVQCVYVYGANYTTGSCQGPLF
ncbi:hypothetical protein [Isoalcanivorax indicus]|uniref:hypothetical protein n=1 Tax=Isoalcanivorax indicus TaxID=2202653 RepID=UPI0013C43E43|nr:hypothetical protein [Isoalcanivorax indicus]